MGTTINFTTLAFQPTELSTIRKTLGIDQNIGTYQLDFREWGTDCTVTRSTATAADGVVGVWNPCSAILAIPSKVLGLQPAWSTCAPGVGATGAHDPPSALIPAAGGFAPITLPQRTTTTSALPSGVPESIPSNTIVSSPSGITSSQIVTVPSSAVPIDPPTPSVLTLSSSPAGASTSNPNDPPPVSTPGPFTSHSDKGLNALPSNPNLSSISSSPEPVAVTSTSIPSTDPNPQVTPTPAATPGLSGVANSLTPSITFGGQTVAIPSIGASAVTLGSAVVSAYGSPATVSGIAVSLGSSALVVGTATIALAGSDSHPLTSPLVFGGLTASILPSGVAFGTNVIIPGQAITISGLPITLGSAGLVVASSTIPLSQNLPSPIVVNGLTASIVPSGVVIGSQTVSFGQSAITVSGTPVSMGAAGIVIAGSTIPITRASVLATVAGEPITAAGSSGILEVAGSTVRPGGPQVTISGTPVSLGLSGVLVIGTSTITPSVEPILTRFVVGTDTFTVSPTNITVEGFTLTPGSPGVTVDGVFVSFGSSDLVVGTQTETFSPQGTSSLVDLGALIMSGLGEIGGTTVTAQPTSTTAGINPFLGVATQSVLASSIPMIVGIMVLWILCFTYI